MTKIWVKSLGIRIRVATELKNSLSAIWIIPNCAFGLSPFVISIGFCGRHIKNSFLLSMFMITLIRSLSSHIEKTLNLYRVFF